MTDPIVLPVATSSDGLELVETLARRGLAAALVAASAGWRVEIPAHADHRATLLDAVSLALEDATPPGESPPVGAGALLRDLRPRRALVAPPLRVA